MAWLWKDHTGVAEAAEITALAKKIRPQFLAKCGGTIRANGFSAKFCIACAPRRRCSTPRIRGLNWPISFPPNSPARSRRTNSSPAFAPPVTRRCGTRSGAAIPTRNFLSQLDPKLGALRARLPARVHSIDRAVGGLTAAWAKKTGLPAGIPVAVGAFDAHLGRDRLRRGAGSAGQNHRHQHLRHRRMARAPKSWRTFPACAASWTAACCRVISDSKPASRRSATFSTGGSITSSPAGKKPLSHADLDKAAGRLQPGESRPAGAGLEQRQPHDPGGSAAHRPACSARRFTPRRWKSIARWSKRRRLAR